MESHFKDIFPVLIEPVARPENFSDEEKIWSWRTERKNESLRNLENGLHGSIPMLRRNISQASLCLFPRLGT